jgi:uncharacterized coiled-coil DUF342 family protein
MPTNNTDEAVLDNRPVAVRRKRRSSTGLRDPIPDIQYREPENLDGPAHGPSEVTQTPTKPKKRVRFSDPGPDFEASSSTGLTPALKRSTLITSVHVSAPAEPRWLAQSPRRRRSLPALRSTSLPSPSLSPPATPCISGEIQFESLRQVLDPRSRRRLRRNNLSEEINSIDAEKKSKSQWKQEIQELKDALALAKKPVHEANDLVEDRAGSNDRIEGLEEELSNLRRQLREKSITAEPPSDTLNCTGSPPDSSIYSEGDTNDEFLMSNFDDNGGLRDGSNEIPPSAAEATTQVSLPSPLEASAFRSIRLALEYLFPGETPLGLATEDPGSIIEAMLDRLQSLKAQAILAETSLSASKSQEANLRSQFNAVLQQLDRARIHAEGLSEQITTAKAKGDEVEKWAQRLEAGVEVESRKAQELGVELDEKQRSIEKLQEALETYRVEVSKLETLINKLERDHGTAIADMQTKMDETVADLECHVAAEISGRKAAEREAVERGERIKQLEGMEFELKNTINEKQSIIRDMEMEMAREKEAREKEVGVMNVRVGELSSNLAEAVSDLANLEQDNRRLVERLEQEKAAGIRSMEVVKTKAIQWAKDVQTMRDNHVQDMQRRGTEVAEHRGLLTPVSACKFKDVEGYVEVRRGKAKRRPDSGIGILEELEDEDLMIEDV